MLVDNEVQISVSEPWDFTSSDGNNKFIGKILNTTSDNYGEKKLVEIKAPFYLNKLYVKYVITVPRQKGNVKNINIYHIPEEQVGNLDSVENLMDKATFIAIGSY